MRHRAATTTLPRAATWTEAAVEAGEEADMAVAASVADEEAVVVAGEAAAGNYPWKLALRCV